MAPCPTCGRDNPAEAAYCSRCRTALPKPGADARKGYGDAAGEHERMPRGNHGAWPHVAIGFAYSVMAWTALLVRGSEWLADRLGLRAPSEAFEMGLLGAAIALSFAVFHDRWRCIEARTSELVVTDSWQVSMWHAPVVALVYAHLRGAQKLLGR